MGIMGLGIFLRYYGIVTIKEVPNQFCGGGCSADLLPLES